MSGRVPTLRLRLPRIETKPKPVYAEQWQDFVGVGKIIALRDELPNELVLMLEITS